VSPADEKARPENATTAQPDWPPAVIAGAFQTGVLGVRTLKRRQVRVASFDPNPQQPGFRSVYGKAVRCPNPDSASDAWATFMVELAGSMGARPALISSSDQFVTATARHADLLEQHFLLSPGCRLQGLLADKQSQYDLASKNGMPMPRTADIRSEAEIARLSREVHYPCLLKPLHFRQWQKFPSGHPLAFQKVAIAKDATELIAHYRQVATVNPHVMLQEIIEGPDTNKRVYLACYDATSRRIGHAMFRELRCDPMGFGPATISHPVDDPETDRVCDEFLRRIGYIGICEIEMKWDDRDGRVKLIEANPRLSGGGDAAPYAGVDLCWIHYLDLIGQPVTPVSPSGNDFRHIVLRPEGRALAAYWRAGLLTWRDIRESYKGPLAFYDLDPKDLRYSLETLYIAGRSFIAEALRKMPA
jgi:D-aspartate ligase